MRKKPRAATQSIMKMKIQEVGANKIGGGSDPNPNRFHSLMDGFGRSKPHPSNLLSPSLNPKREEQAPTHKGELGLLIWAGLPTLQKGPQS